MKLAATGPRVGAAEGGLLDVGYFLTMGVINPYGLVTVPWDFYSKTFFYLGGPFLKGGQFFGSFDPNRLKIITAIKKFRRYVRASRDISVFSCFFMFFLFLPPSIHDYCW